MLKKILLLLLTFSFIALASSELLISQAVDINVKQNTLQQFSMNLTNTFNFAIMDFEFRNLTGFHFPNITIQPNQSIVVSYNVTQSEISSYSKDVLVIFKYLVDIPPNTQTMNVNITPNGFNPDFLTIHEGDTIIWTNGDDLSHTVTSGSFDSNDISPGQTYERTFQNIETIDYQDLNLFLSGRIQVLNRSTPQKVNNPNYNKIVKFNVNVYSDPTNLSVNVLESNYNINAWASGEGMLSIKNIGEEQAQKILVTSSSSWVKFDKNNINLEKGAISYIPFTIQPVILSSNDTNKNYEININIKGLNTESFNTKINVFIPFSDELEQASEDEKFLEAYDRWCQANPTRPLCTGYINTSGNGSQVVYRDPQIPVNYTVVARYNEMKDIQKIKDSIERTNNDLKLTNDKISTEMPQIKSLLNQSLEISNSAEQRSKEIYSLFWIVSIFSILIGGFLISWKYIAKYQEKRVLMGRAKP